MSVSHHEFNSSHQSEPINGDNNNLPNDEKKQKYQAIHKLLELERPIITAKMVQYLLKKDVFCYLISLITQLDGKGVRPKFGSEVTENLIWSYRSAHLLANEQSTDNLQILLEKHFVLLLDNLFDIFKAESSGSFFHACLVFNNLFQWFPDQVYHHISCDVDAVDKFFGLMLANLEHPPIADFFLDIICSGYSDLCQFGPYEPAPSYKWDMFQSLSSWGLLEVFITEICSTDKSIEHICACVDTMIRLISRFAEYENGGARMLQPIVDSPEMIEKLLQTIFAPQYCLHQRTECARVIFFLLERMKNEEMMIIQPQFNGSPQTLLIKNQLYQFASQFRDEIEAFLPSFFSLLLNFDLPQDIDSSYVHPGSKQEQCPFTILRLYILKILICLISYDSKILEKIPQELWSKFADWIFQYPENNIYHGLFYQLLFHVLRYEDEPIKKCLLSEQFLTKMINLLTSNDQSGCKPHILRYCNAIRLQMDLEPQDSFLFNLLRVHRLWRSFLPKLREITISENNPGLGFKIPSHKGAQKNEDSEAQSQLDEYTIKNGIDHGSDYAKKLGFDFGVHPQSITCQSDSEYEINQESEQQILSANNIESQLGIATLQVELGQIELTNNDLIEICIPVNNINCLMHSNSKTMEGKSSKKNNTRRNKSRRRKPKQTKDSHQVIIEQNHQPHKIVNGNQNDFLSENKGDSNEKKVTTTLPINSQNNLPKKYNSKKSKKSRHKRN